jgi:hypothetical protein
VAITVITAEEMGVVTAYQDDGSGVAQFEYVLDQDPPVCRFAGTAIAG